MREAVHNETMFFRVNAALAAKLREKAAVDGASPSEYLRELVRRDLRQAA